MAPTLLKTKGGKHFGALASLSDADSLQLTWKVSSKIAAHLEQGERIENLSWRLWHIRDLMVGDEAETSSRGAARSACTASTHSRSCSTSGHCAEERAFNKLSASVATKLEGEKRLPISDLSAPTFRWTDTSDTIRYRGVMRSHRREQTRPLNLYNNPTRSSVSPCPPANQTCPREGIDGIESCAERTTASLAPSRRRKRRQSDDGDSPPESSSPSASSSSPITFFSGKATPESRSETRQASPPVCWRLTKEKAACQGGARQEIERHHERRVQDAPQDLDSRSAWTLQQIEDAERELQEQGVELSGPFVAMLADLKAGDLARVKGFMSDDCNPATKSGKQDEHNQLYKKQNPKATLRVVTSPIAGVNEDINTDLEGNEKPERATDAPSAPTTPNLNSYRDSNLETRQEAAKDMPAVFTASKPRLSDTGGDKIPDNTLADLEETASIKIQDSTEQIHSDASTQEHKPRDKPQCTNCGATSTPLWRRDANFELQCNACGLYEKLHKAPRPRSLKQRRSDRRIGKDSPGEGQSSHRSSLSPDDVAPSGRDEWVGIHAGSICANCGTSTTPLWRKDREGRIICNACGLYYKLHNAHRPTTMRMDAIKRRSRYDDRRRAATLSTDMSTHGHRTPVAGEEDGGDMAPMFPGFALPPSIHVAGPGADTLPQYNNMPTQTAFGPGAPFMGAQGPPMVSMPAQQHPHDYQPGRAPPFRHMPSNGAQHIMGPHAGIHIPAALWEHQVCPMGAWGENCCQNLPQPPPDIQSALMVSNNAASSSSGPPHGADGGMTDGGREQGSEALSVTAAMDAILGSNDWMLDFGCGTGLPEDIIMSTLNEAAPTGTGISANPQHFDPSAVSGASDASIVGPTLPLRRRKDTSSQPKKVNEDTDTGASHSANDETMQAVLHTTPSAGSLHAATPSSDVAQSLPGASVGDARPDGMQNVSASTQAAWWPFASSPEAVR